MLNIILSMLWKRFGFVRKPHVVRERIGFCSPSDEDYEDRIRSWQDVSS